MDFIHKDFRIIKPDSSTKDSTQLQHDIIDFSMRLRWCFRDSFSHSRNKSNALAIDIHIPCLYDFLVAFLGALHAGISVHIVHKKEPSKRLFIDDISAFVKETQGLESALDSYKVPDSWLDSAVFYVRTSGSSGESKIIAKTLNMFILEARALQKHLQINPSHTIISSPSHHHMYGLTFKAFLPLVSGACVESRECMFLEHINAFASIYRDICFVATPTILSTFCKSTSLSCLKSMSHIISAGSKLQAETIDSLLEVCDKDSRIIEIYGSTETGIIAYNENSKRDTTRDTFKLFENVEANLNPDNCLVVRSPWQQGNINVHAFTTSDCAIIEGDSLRLLGRADRIVKIHERRVSLEGVEKTLLTHEYVNEAHVFVYSSLRLGAMIVPSDKGKHVFVQHGKSAIASSLKAHLKSDFGALVRHFYVCDSLPYNAQGKITQDSVKLMICTKKTPSFEILHKDKTSLLARAYVSPECFYFDGHFSHFPIVPGFVELEFVVELSRHLGLKTQDIAEIKHAKWTHLVRPYNTLELRLRLESKHLYFRLYANERECANGKIALRAQEN